jgi:hypothetical protein
VAGIVHPLGAGGGRVGSEKGWTLRFWFVPWRRKGGEIDERQLELYQPNLPDAELRKMMASIKPYDILRVRVRFSAAAGDANALRAKLVEILGKESSDDELSARAEQLQQPVTVDHPFFGTFTLDRKFNQYAVTFPWNSQPVRLHLSRDGREDERELFAAAVSLWKQQKKWDKRIRDFAVAKLLDLKNDAWLGDDEKEFTPTRFKAQMTPESIALHPDGRFEFFYNDGNLFWGHVILIDGTLQGGPTNADIAG